MRLAVPAAVVAGIITAVGVAVAAGDGERSACGEVGDHNRAVAPDGRRSAFVRCTRAGSAWLVVSEGGTERRILPAAYGCCYRPSAEVVLRDPAWSPDGRRLAVVIEDVGGADVWTLELAGRRARRATHGPAVERRPRWSPDGRRITFVTETGELASVAVGRPAASP